MTGTVAETIPARTGTLTGMAGSGMDDPNKDRIIDRDDREWHG